MAQSRYGNEPTKTREVNIYKSNALESWGTDICMLLYNCRQELGNKKTGRTSPQHFAESLSSKVSTALESQGTDNIISSTAQSQMEVTETDRTSSNDKALESRGTYYTSYRDDIKDLESQVTHFTSSQDVTALESQGTYYACTSSNKTDDTTFFDKLNALESQGTGCTSFDDLNAVESHRREDALSNELTALESQGTGYTTFDDLNAVESHGREDALSNELTALENQGTGYTSSEKFNALESQEMNTTLPAASQETVSQGVSSASASIAVCESNALESQGMDDSLSQAATFKMLFGGTTGISLSQKSKVASESTDKGSQGVIFTDSILSSSCFAGFLPRMKVCTIALAPVIQCELEQCKPVFICPSNTVLVYEHQRTPLIKPFNVTMEDERDLVQIE